MSDSADHFDHDAHVKALEDASNHLYRDGEGAGVDGERLAGSLPGTNTSPTETAFAVVELWRRQGLITRSTMEGLIAERPRQAEAIRRVFEQFGVH